MAPSDRLIVALDVPDLAAAADLVRKLSGRVRIFKVGLELFHAAGPAVFAALRDAGAERIFYDAKLHDIPNTVARTCRTIAHCGVFMTNVHAAGGTEMMQAAVKASKEAAQEAGLPAPLILAVTLLTSLTPLQLAVEMRVDCSAVDYVTYLTRFAQQSGCHGVVCSPQEIEAVRWAAGPDFLIVTPGVRPSWAEAGDQKRITTPAQAVKLGADYIVVGRPITAAPDPAAAAARIVEEIAATS